MIDTNRIRSGFDVEFQLGRGWFLTALNGLAERGLLIPPGTIPFIADDAKIEVTDVTIIFEPANRDLRVEILIGDLLPATILASLSLSDDGRELIIDNSLADEPTVVPFGVLDGLAAPPELVKLQGNNDHEPAIALLANLDLRAGPQSGPPLPAGEHVPRGNSADALSILPLGQDVAVGVPQAALSRFANDIWHSQLADDDGNHPFPDAEDEQGDWRSVSMFVQNGRTAFEGEDRTRRRQPTTAGPEAHERGSPVPVAIHLVERLCRISRYRAFTRRPTRKRRKSLRNRRTPPVPGPPAAADTVPPPADRSHTPQT